MLKSFTLQLMSALAVLTLSQCAWPEPRYETRYEGPPFPRPLYHDAILGDPDFSHCGLRCLTTSPLWARLHQWEVGDCYLCPPACHAEREATAERKLAAAVKHPAASKPRSKQSSKIKEG